jgi:DUF4097 and DUF4098 domain-containing protein YvlB
MRKRVAILLLGLLVAIPATRAGASPAPESPAHLSYAASPQRDSARAQQQERFTRTVRLGRSGLLTLSNITGNVVATGVAGEQVEIEVVKRARAATDELARQHLAAITVDVVERPGRVEIRTVYPDRDSDRGRNRDISVSVDYRLNVPVGTSVNLRTVSGDVRIANVEGEVRANTVSGSIHASSAPRLDTLKAVSGKIEIENSAAEGRLAVSTVSGGIQAEGLRADNLEFETVSGNIHLTDVQSNRARLSSISGSITYDGSLSPSGRYEVKAHSGRVLVRVPRSAGFELEANTFSGNITTDVPLTLRSGMSADKRQRRGAISGVHGDGGALLQITTFSGNIAIEAR